MAIDVHQWLFLAITDCEWQFNGDLIAIISFNRLIAVNNHEWPLGLK